MLSVFAAFVNLSIECPNVVDKKLGNQNYFAVLLFSNIGMKAGCFQFIGLFAHIEFLLKGTLLKNIVYSGCIFCQVEVKKHNFQ